MSYFSGPFLKTMIISCYFSYQLCHTKQIAIALKNRVKLNASAIEKISKIAKRECKTLDDFYAFERVVNDIGFDGFNIKSQPWFKTLKK